MIDFDAYENWYKDDNVKFNIIMFTYRRELCMFPPAWANMPQRSIRMLRCHNVQGYNFLLRYLRVFKRKTLYNLYYSMAEYQGGIPKQNMDDWDKRKIQNDEWTKIHYQSMKSYDFLLDIDAPDYSQVYYAYESAKLIKKWFDNNFIPYEVRYSGMGFHFIIPYRYFPSGLDLNPHVPKENTLYHFMYKFACFLYNEFSELIDLKIYDSRRVCKIPYTLAVHEKDLYVCSPFLSHREFNEFEIEDYEWKAYLTNNALKNRGIYLFNDGGDLEKVKKIIK